jgi:UDP-GlcNAc:undecaprenyl-phosphate GlcNAc-1-phosphate transferase
LLSAFICSNARAFAHATLLLDRPDGKLKMHAGDTPLIGGIAMLVPSFLASFLYYCTLADAPFMLTALGAAGLALVIGLIDDRLGLSPVSRFSALAGIVMVVFMVEPLFVLRALRFGIHGFDFGFSLGLFAAPFTLVVILGFVNATNMADGMNGQLIGSVLVWSFFIASYLGTEPAMPYIAIFCCAAVTLAFNLRGRLFSGSAGAYPVSLFVALGTIAAYRRGGALSAVEPVLWFWLPVVDCVRLVISRSLAGRSPFFGDREHIHHILQEYMRPPLALAAYLGLLAAPGIAALATEDRLPGCIILLLCLGGYVALVFAHARSTSVAHEKPADRTVNA